MVAVHQHIEIECPRPPADGSDAAERHFPGLQLLEQGVGGERCLACEHGVPEGVTGDGPHRRGAVIRAPTDRPALRMPCEFREDGGERRGDVSQVSAETDPDLVHRDAVS